VSLSRPPPQKFGAKYSPKSMCCADMKALILNNSSKSNQYGALDGLRQPYVLTFFKQAPMDLSSLNPAGRLLDDLELLLSFPCLLSQRRTVNDLTFETDTPMAGPVFLPALAMTPAHSAP